MAPPLPHLDGLGLPLDKVERVLCAVAVDGARLVVESHAVALVCDVNNLWSKGSADELGTDLGRDGLEEGGDGGTILGVQVGVDFVKDDHGTALGSLQRKDETQSTQTYIVLARVIGDSEGRMKNILF